MGDALCGPSNALQNFQKHASVDRTLQQDRLTSRQSPVQGFRSQSSRDGILDPEFAAFEANLGGPALPDLHHPVQFGGPARLPATLPATSHANSSWASDFQNLHITSPSPAQFQRPAVAPAQTGWQNEFLSQQQRAPAHHAQTQSNMTRAFQPSFQPSYPMYNASLDAHQALPESQPGHLAPAEQFDESAFEAAFEQARTDVELHGADATPAVEQELHETGRVDTAGNNTEEIRIGSDTIPQTDKQDPQAQAGDADALAQTAGHLLDSVRHDQSEKFQQSNFLALMRRIRDREVQVEGDEFRETAQSLHPGGKYYPGQTHPGDSAESFDSTTQHQHGANLDSHRPEGTRETAQDTPLAEEVAHLGNSSFDSGDSNGLYEGWIHSQGLLDRRQPTFCFRGEREIW